MMQQWVDYLVELKHGQIMVSQLSNLRKVHENRYCPQFNRHL